MPVQDFSLEILDQCTVPVQDSAHHQASSAMFSQTSSQEALSPLNKDKRQMSRFAKVRTFLGSSPSSGSKTPSSLPSPVILRSDSEGPIEPPRPLDTQHHSQGEQLEQQQHQGRQEQLPCGSTILQLDSSPHADGIFRPGDRSVATLTFNLRGKDGRGVVSVKSKLKGVRECQLFVPSDESDPLFRQHDVPKRRAMISSAVTFWTDRCSMFSKEELSTLRNQRDPTAEGRQEPVSARFEFLLPEKLNATWQDDFTADELARPRRMRHSSRMPIDLPPTLDVRVGRAQQLDKEETNTFLQKAAQWMQNTKNDEKWAKVEYSIEVVLKRQKLGWAGRLGATKKERLSTTFPVHPYPPFSKTVPTPVAPVPAILPLLTRDNDRRRANRASMIVESSNRTNGGGYGEDSVQHQRRRSLQVDVGSLTTPLQGAMPSGSATTFTADDDNLQIVTNERGRQQAWYKHSAVDDSGKVYMELSFPALASISTDCKVPFLLRLSLPRGSQPKTSPVRMSLLRSITSRTQFGTIKFEDRVSMNSPSGESAVTVSALIRREDQRMDLPHRAGAEVQNFEGCFFIHGYTAPSQSRSSSSDSAATTAQGLGLDIGPGGSSPFTVRNTKDRLIDASQRTVPSFTFKNLQLSYSLLVQVGIDTPSLSHPGRFDQGFGQLEVPTICLASEPIACGTNGSRRNTFEANREGTTRGHGGFVQNLGGGGGGGPAAVAAETYTPDEHLVLHDADPAECTPHHQAEVSIGQSSGGGRPLSRIRALPTYSSLYLRDMARRATGGVGVGVRCGEHSPSYSLGEESSGSSDNGLEHSVEVVAGFDWGTTAEPQRYDRIGSPCRRGRVVSNNTDDRHPNLSLASSPTAERQEAPDGQPYSDGVSTAAGNVSLAIARETEARATSMTSDRGPSPPYIEAVPNRASGDCMSATSSRGGPVEHTVASPQQHSSSPRPFPVEEAEESMLETTVSTQLLDLLFESTGETLPPGYPVSLRTPRGGSGNGHGIRTVMIQEPSTAAVAVAAAAGSSLSTAPVGRSRLASTGSVATILNRESRGGALHNARESSM